MLKYIKINKFAHTTNLHKKKINFRWHFGGLLLILTVTNKCKPPKFLNYCICMKRKTLCNCLCSSYPTSSSHDFARVIWNIRLFRAKIYFTDHRVAHRIYSFRDSVLVLKILDCYWDMQKFEQSFILILQAIAGYKARALCWCK